FHNAAKPRTYAPKLGCLSGAYHRQFGIGPKFVASANEAHADDLIAEGIQGNYAYPHQRFSLVPVTAQIALFFE
ncbi:MAG TPA: hypothetical protein VN899_07865, partial [Stellaceae bacterium]|nr:hypothetical protein [Stellaceae bacterium]